MKHYLRHLAPLTFTLLFLAACSQVTPSSPSNLQAAAATQVPLPALNSTFVGDTRGFWFQAPVDFRITGLRVPNEGNQSLQNVEVFKLSSPPPEYPASATGGQVFYKTGVPTGGTRRVLWRRYVNVARIKHCVVTHESKFIVRHGYCLLKV